ncbi:MAG: hypothetical protein ACLFR7_00960 [Opitutales bacterium]
MIRRVEFGSWDLLLIVVFFITFGAFVYFTWRALRMKQRERDHLANLPLESDDNEDRER